MKMTKEESDDINAHWRPILGEFDEVGGFSDEQNQDAIDEINWIYKKAYDAGVKWIEQESDRVKVSEYFEGPDYENYCVDAGDEMFKGMINGFGVEDVLYWLKESVIGRDQGQVEYSEYHQRIMNLKPLMQPEMSEEK